jgi:serine/threonine-protein kinase
MQAEHAMDPLVGQVLGPYQLHERLGSGSMGRVYRAVHTELGHPRAVKVLSATMATNPIFIRRFKREARLAGDLQHPHIIPVFDIGSAGSIHYLAMALLDGRSLEQVLQDEGPLDLDRTVTIVRQLAEALDFAHAHGVAHRDVKPGNVVVTPTTQPSLRPSEHVTLIDFGIARMVDGTALTRSGTFIGTAQYMAPEVALGQPNGPDSDLYALGILTYELLTGRVPFTAGNPQTLMYAQVHQPVPLLRLLCPDLSAAVETVVLRQLAKQPDDRYRSAMAFATALAEATTVQQQVQPPQPPELPATFTMPVLPSRSNRPARPALPDSPWPRSASAQIPAPPMPVLITREPRPIASPKLLARGVGSTAATRGIALLSIVALIVAAFFATAFLNSSPADIVLAALGTMFVIFVVVRGIAAVTKSHQQARAPERFEVRDPE